LLIRLGEAHERAYLNQLTEEGRTIVSIPTEGRDGAARTVEAIRAGADVIYQATFLGGQDGSGLERKRLAGNAAAGSPAGASEDARAPGNVVPGDAQLRLPGVDEKIAPSTNLLTSWYGRADFLIRVDKRRE